MPRAQSWLLLRWAVAGVLLLALGAASVWVLAILDRQRPASRRAAELSYLPKGEYLRVAVLGYRQITADLIWLKAVQHFGEGKQTKQGYLWAYHAVDVVTDLDPKFWFAYQAAGTILGVWAGLVHESVAILTKGMRHNPDVWQLPFYVAYDYYYELCDTTTAAKYFRIAAQLPQAPTYLPRLTAKMLVEAGDPDAALEFLQRLYDQQQDERLREALVQRMKQVVAERDIRFLEEGVRRFKLRYGKLPRSLTELVTKRIIVRLPDDPLGGTYELNASNGSVTSTGLRERLKVYRKVSCQRPVTPGRPS